MIVQHSSELVNEIDHFLVWDGQPNRLPFRLQSVKEHRNLIKHRVRIDGLLVYMKQGLAHLFQVQVDLY